LSVQVIGRSWAEAEVLSVAAWCERVVEFEHREVPLLR
jgi:Asp-tRNA(Asn)/Glu-tRNA(Gln) amidotransferase A subunit family amidase